jgi:hypothetical protein
MGGVTEDQQPPDAPDEAPPDDDGQPIVPMLDLSDEPAAPAAPEAEPSRLRMVGGILLLFGALGLVVALVLPLYRISFDTGLIPPGEGRSGGVFTVNAWGLIGSSPSTDPISQAINVIVGNTPTWGVPLVFVALLLTVAGSVALWRPDARSVPAAAIAATALLAGCFAMLVEFVINEISPDRIGGPITGSIGAGFWLLVFAVVFAIAGLAAVLRGRSTPPAPVSEAEREEPETPPMGFPAPVVLPRLDDQR